ncbi:MAG: hypothetical protein ABI693_16720 [Bryobacteraceae bacterium]
MKNLMIHSALLIAIGFVATSAAPIASAQHLADMRVAIPFEFQAAGRTLPAGDYTFTVHSGSRIDLQSAKGNTIFVATNPTGRAPGEYSSVVFHRYGSTHFLSQVVSTRQQYGLELPVSKAERAYTNIASAAPAVETIAGSR